MLQDLPCPLPAMPHQPNTPMQRHPPPPPPPNPPIDASMQNITIIKHGIARLHLHRNLPRQPPLIRPGLPLPVRTHPAVRPGHDDQRRIVVQRNVVLRMRLPPAGALGGQLPRLLGGRHVWTHVVAVPDQFEIGAARRADEQVEQLHY